MESFQNGLTFGKADPVVHLLLLKSCRFIKCWEVVVAQLVERSLSIPEVRGSTPDIGKILLNICLLSTVLKRRK